MVLQNVKNNPHPVFFVSVAFKGLNLSVSLLFATLTGGSISVAAKGLNPIVASGQWKVVSGEKKYRGSSRESGEGSARMLSEDHMEG